MNNENIKYAFSIVFGMKWEEEKPSAFRAPYYMYVNSAGV